MKLLQRQIYISTKRNVKMIKAKIGYALIATEHLQMHMCTT